MADKISDKQYNVLAYIYDQVQSQGYPPTVREIGKAVGLSSISTVHGHLDRLQKNGYLQKNPNKTRAIDITEKGLEVLGVKHSGQMPLLGLVTAGEPILAVQNATDYFPIPPEFKNDEDDLFMLTIRGESMINAGILSGDKVIVKKQPTADNGEIVIAMNDENEATCKRFFKENNHFRLQPENDTMDPIILKNVRILGKVIGLFRNNI